MPFAPVADLMTTLLREPGRPRLTWYGPDGERVELSGAVLDNWVSKTTNLLVEEFDAGPGTVVHLDLPPHWRSVVWALAVWRAGACVRVGAAPDSDQLDVIVTDRPEGVARGHAVIVAVALPALARSFGGELPAGAIDAAGAVMTYGDVIGWSPAVEPDAPALAGHLPGGGTVPHAELIALAERAGDRSDGARALVRVSHDRERTTATVLVALKVLAGGGSLVLLSGGTDERAARIAGDERVTADLGSV